MDGSKVCRVIFNAQMQFGFILVCEKTQSNLFLCREWTQKALEEEQKKREEERRKRDEEREKKKQQQQQLHQNLKTSDVGNANATSVDAGSPGSGANGGGTRTGGQQATLPVRLKKNFASPVSSLNFFFCDKIINVSFLYILSICIR